MSDQPSDTEASSSVDAIIRNAIVQGDGSVQLGTTTITQTQGHPDSPGPYVDRGVDPNDHWAGGTAPAGSYAAGSQRAAAESARLQAAGIQRNGGYPGTDDVRYTHTEGTTALLASILAELKGLRGDMAATRRPEWPVPAQEP